MPALLIHPVVMVATLAALLFAPAQTLVAAEAYVLKTEFSKNPIYEGESATVKFVLYGTASFVEAEVAKFPEFRGFWTQNHVLRQGPLPLVPEGRMGLPRQETLNQALVGSYTITPMVGRRETQVIPMKMILRSHDFFQNESKEEGMEIWSEREELRVLPLPPVPADLQKQFDGAVGSLSLQNENEAVYFHPDEPFTIRISARGTGNFADITELYLAPTERVQVVSRRTFQDPTVPPTKTFEFTLVVQGATPLELPPAQLAFFNPYAKKYELASAPGIRLEPQPSPPLEFVEPEWFGTPVAAELPRYFWRDSVAFWGAQALIALFFLALLLRRAKHALDRRPAARYRLLWKQQAQQVESALQTGETLSALRELERLLMRATGRAEEGRASAPPRNHPEALSRIEKNGPPRPSKRPNGYLKAGTKVLLLPKSDPSPPPLPG